MNNKQRVALAGVQLALVGMWSCASDPNNVIIGGTPQGGGGASAAGSSPAGASGSGTAGQTTQAGASGAPVTGGSGGSSAGSGGSSAGSGGSSAGSGGSVAGAASICTPASNQVDCNNVLSGFDGYANLDNANGASQGPDALQPNCVGSENAPKIFKQKHWQLTGPGITAGTKYKVDLHFYGVVECKTYVGGTGPAKTDSEQLSTSVAHNLWLQGAKDNADHWNTYVFTVTPNSSSGVVGIGPQMDLPELNNSYVINQCPGAKGEGHYTYRLDFTSSITVPGGSWINYVEYDTNCRMIANCGAAEAAQNCNGPYNVIPNVSQAVPATNAGFTQPLANNNNPPSRGQWWLVDVTAITPAP